MHSKPRALIPFLLTLVLAAVAATSCSRESIPSEDLFFQALEQAASGNVKNAAASLSECIERKDEWADVASEQLLELLSDYPYLEIPSGALKTAREYHPLKQTSLQAKKDYQLTFSASSLAGFSSQMLDDIGSSWVTGAVDKREAADLMAEASSLKETRTLSPDSASEKWLLSFYAGRLYEKNGSSTYQTALSWYSRACSESFSELSYDRPLWYFLELNRKISPQNTATLLPQYAGTWNDSAYFDDFLDRLASNLLSNYDWKTFFRVFCENESFFSNASRAKYAVISARLMESGLCSSDSQYTPSDLYDIAHENAEYGSYYDLLARYQTGRAFPEPTALSSEIPLSGSSISEDVTIPENDETTFTERLLGKLIVHDYADLVFRTLSEKTDELSAQAIQDAYTYLLSKAGSEQKYLSLTTLGLKAAYARPDEDELLTLAYPPYYRTYVEAEARQFGLEPWLLFALIHSESCFQADITSVAGANGLTQLMASTAGDVARKLKVADYDLTDAHTNVTFGSYYLSELIGRLDGDILMAAFSYNAGITRVRSWKKQAPSLPPDIFLETLPYEETRLYGQKITRAAVMYAVLYYGVLYEDVMEHILHIR